MGGLVRDWQVWNFMTQTQPNLLLKKKIVTQPNPSSPKNDPTRQVGLSQFWWVGCTPLTIMVFPVVYDRKLFVFTTWKRAKKAIGPTFNHNCIWPAVYSLLPLNPVTSIGHPWILLFGIPVACSILSGMRFIEALVSTTALLMEIWFMEATK